MRILFLSSWFPYPPDNGSRIRVFNLLKHLSQNHNVTLLSFTQADSDPRRASELLKYCQEIHTVPAVSYQPRRWRAIQGFLSPHPRFIVDTFSPEMKTLVWETVESKSFDLVLASQASAAPYVQGLDSADKVFEEVELTVIREQFAAEVNPLRRLRFGLTWWKATRFMVDLLREFDACTVVSDQERAHILERVPDYPVTVVPNGVDLNWYQGDFGDPEGDTLIFPASLTYFANLDAMEFFLKGVFPRIRFRRPDIILRITGRTDGVLVDRLSLGEGVVLTGYLDDIRPAIVQSWICVVPLRIGGGTRLKILEAMALGTPVVSTSKGAEGLEVTHNEDILIADEPAEFADAVLHLLSDKSLRAKLATNGRRLVEERYSWETCAQKLEQLLSWVVEQKARKGD
jgi:sugar transferase (PEP-CTERM/EpsH1 system associated)